MYPRAGGPQCFPPLSHLAAPVLLIATLLATSSAAHADDELAGWQGMRIVKQEGSPQHMIAADLAGNGRSQLIAVNTRMSRLDIYRWLPAEERKEPFGGRCRPSERSAGHARLEADRVGAR